MPLGGVTDSEIDTSGDESKVPKAVRKARQALEKQNVDVSCLQVSDLAKLDKGGICLRMLCHDVMLSGCSPDRLACFSAGGHSQNGRPHEEAVRLLEAHAGHEAPGFAQPVRGEEVGH